MNLDLDDMKRLLPCPIPSAYVEYVEASQPADLKKRGFDPKTLCVLNLELRDMDREGWTKDRFFLSGDGSGNYYFVTSKGTKTSQVKLWAHDPSGIEDQGDDLKTFLSSATQENPLITSARPKTFCIARTEVVGESILQPITLAEWKTAIAACEGVEYRGYRTGKNPFTGEALRKDLPGLAVATIDGKEVHLRRYCGRVEGDDSPPVRAVAEKLARALQANLMVKAK
jgi:hypothetical protein